MEKLCKTGLALALVMLLSACSSLVSPSLTSSSPSSCSNPVELSIAIDTLMKAKLSVGDANVYGEKGGGTNNLMELLVRSNISAMKNPRGQGVLVSLVYAGGKAMEWDTARRAGWLVLDGVLYPIDTDSAQAFGRLWSGYPDDVLSRIGDGESYLGMRGLGIEDFISYNSDRLYELDEFLKSANQLCENPTMWGS